MRIERTSSEYESFAKEFFKVWEEPQKVWAIREPKGESLLSLEFMFSGYAPTEDDKKYGYRTDNITLSRSNYDIWVFMMWKPFGAPLAVYTEMFSKYPQVKVTDKLMQEVRRANDAYVARRMANDLKEVLDSDELPMWGPEENEAFEKIREGYETLLRFRRIHPIPKKVEKTPPDELYGDALEAWFQENA